MKMINFLDSDESLESEMIVISEFVLVSMVTVELFIKHSHSLVPPFLSEFPGLSVTSIEHTTSGTSKPDASMQFTT